MGKVENGGLQAEDVTIGTESHNLTYSHLSEVGMVAKCFAASEVGKMHFDGGNIDASDGVAECHTGVGVGTRVDDQRIDPSHRPLDGIDKTTFVVRLEDFEVDVVLSRMLL